MAVQTKRIKPVAMTASPLLAFDYASERVGNSLLLHADCFDWLGRLPENTLHSIVTDPPYGVKEFDADQIDKMKAGKGGIWRLPPAFDGNVRAPLPRFTALDEKERERLRLFFVEWARLALKALRPGGHVIMATNSFVANLCYGALVEGGLEFRGQVVRLVRTLRGGDRPKNAEEEFPGVSSMPRGAFEPWGLLRKPIPKGMTVAECLRTYQTGGLRRYANELPFEDVIDSERTPKHEKVIADHPSLKPQSILRRLVYISLPLGEGVVADPFAGSGSTIAAAEAVGYTSIGIEKSSDYFALAKDAAPKLAALQLEEVDPLVNGPAVKDNLWRKR
jgi:site-specific DNA-methyltransferase (adenine-specific)